LTARYAVVGHPIDHSLSPAFHNHWFGAHDIDAVYGLVDLDPSRPDLATALADTVHGHAGLSLTVPFKRHVIPLLDEVHPAAAAIGAVNTVVTNDGRKIGHNTDGRGFVSALVRRFGPLSPNRPGLVLGSGGAGRAVAAGLAEAGVQTVYLLNRTAERASAVATHLAPHFPHTNFLHGAMDQDVLGPALVQAGVVACCVSGPGVALVRSLDIGALPTDAVWCDLNYWMTDPPHAERLGDRFLSGEPMLRAQAALAFHLWTGVEVDPDGPQIDTGPR